MTNGVYLGVDVGSVSTNLVLVKEHKEGRIELLEKIYMRSEGNPIKSVQYGLSRLGELIDKHLVLGVGVTGSGRKLIGSLLGADIIKNEITAHGIAALYEDEKVQTVIEIGGQDSKMILMRQGTVIDFAMNTVCAAGTGSFLDQQAARLNIPITDFGAIALKSKYPVRIAGRCSVFAESDMIHKQQMGYPLEDIVAGLCSALVRNYLSNVGKGKEILPPVLFQGGVAANAGIKRAFEQEFGFSVKIPQNFEVMGALGAALLAREAKTQTSSMGSETSNFRGLKLCAQEIKVESFECPDCPNHCEVVAVLTGKERIAGWGDRCGKWQHRSNQAIG